MLRVLSRYLAHFEPSNVTCWNCHANEYVNKFICGQCKHLKEPCQSLHDVDYFQLFDLKISVRLDQAYLENKYRELQKNFHPDIFIAQVHLKSVNIDYSQKYSAYINEAYNTLKDECCRAEYVLGLRGYKIKENTHLEDIEFMEQILEKQMRIQERDKLEEMESENDLAIKNMTNRVLELICDQSYSQGFNQLLYLRYYLRLRDQLKMRGNQV